MLQSAPFPNRLLLICKTDAHRSCIGAASELHRSCIGVTASKLLKLSILSLIILPTILIIALLASSCSTTKGQQKRDGTELWSAETLKNQTWQLVEMQGRTLSRSKGIITLILNPEASSISGQSTCNSYAGSWEVERNGVPSAQPTTESGEQVAIKIKDIDASQTQCPEGDMNQERRYLSLLAGADAMEMTPTVMVLYRKGKAILKYELQ